MLINSSEIYAQWRPAGRGEMLKVGRAGIADTKSSPDYSGGRLYEGQLLEWLKEKDAENREPNREIWSIAKRQSFRFVLRVVIAVKGQSCSTRGHCCKSSDKFLKLSLLRIKRTLMQKIVLFGNAW